MLLAQGYHVIDRSVSDKGMHMIAIGVSSDNIKGALTYGAGGTQYRHPLPISANGH
jgi:hypothetical protein